MLQTQDQLVAALAAARVVPYVRNASPALSAGLNFNRWAYAGGVAPTLLGGEQVTNAFSGAIPYFNAATGRQKYLAGWSIALSYPGVASLYDRLWHNGGVSVTTTTVQPISSVGLPARDANGASYGAGVEAWLDIYTALGNASAVSGVVINYTNDAGVSGRTATLAQSIPAAAPAGMSFLFVLQAGDTGVQSVQSITLGTSLVSGAIGITLRRKLADASLVALVSGVEKNFFDLGQRLFDGTCLELTQMSWGAASSAASGTITYIEA